MFFVEQNCVGKVRRWNKLKNYVKRTFTLTYHKEEKNIAIYLKKTKKDKFMMKIYRRKFPGSIKNLTEESTS